MNGKTKNFLRRAAIIQEIVAANYEPENQARCQVQVYRSVINEKYPMSERTFRRHMHADISQLEQKQEDSRYKQLTLW